MLDHEKETKNWQENDLNLIDYQVKASQPSTNFHSTPASIKLDVKLA